MSGVVVQQRGSTEYKQWWADFHDELANQAKLCGAQLRQQGKTNAYEVNGRPCWFAHSTWREGEQPWGETLRVCERKADLAKGLNDPRAVATVVLPGLTGGLYVAGPEAWSDNLTISREGYFSFRLAVALRAKMPDVVVTWGRGEVTVGEHRFALGFSGRNPTTITIDRRMRGRNQDIDKLLVSIVKAIQQLIPEREAARERRRNTTSKLKTNLATLKALGGGSTSVLDEPTPANDLYADEQGVFYWAAWVQLIDQHHRWGREKILLPPGREAEVLAKLRSLRIMVGSAIGMAEDALKALKVLKEPATTGAGCEESPVTPEETES